MASSQVSAVAIKLPTFWISGPEAWFAQTEAQFAIRGINQDDTKYFHVVAALDNDTATRALSVITNPPTTNKYESIKRFLLSAYGLSNTERATALLNSTGLGDRKPSELMDSMLALLGAHEPCFLFKHLFLKQLPEQIRTPLAAHEGLDCRALAQEADKLFLSLNSPSQVLQLKEKPTRDHTPPLCRYHIEFGKKAKKCNPPCAFIKMYSQNQGNAKLGQQ